MLLLLLLLLLLSSIVLVVRKIVLVSTVGSVRVRTIVLSILGTIISSTGSTRSSRYSRWSLSRLASRRLLLVMVAVSTVAAIVMTIAAAITTIAMLRWILLESLILLPHIGQEIFAELFGSLNIVWIGATVSRSVWAA